MQNNYYQTNSYNNNNKNNNNNQNLPNYQIRNFYLSHKIFPKTEISNSEVLWNSVAPRFDYEISMPFVVNQQTAEILDKGAFIIELWHKSTTEDELLGTTKLDFFPIIDSLRINEDTLSIIPISRNLQPLIIYDGNYPVFNYDSFSNIYHLDLTVAVGTTAQINNYIKKSKGANQRLQMQQSQYNSLYSGMYASGENKQQGGNLNFTNSETLKNPGAVIDYNLYNNYASNYHQQQQQPNFGFGKYNDNFNSKGTKNNLTKNNHNNYQNNEINDDEIFEINNIMNNNNKNTPSDIGGISNTNFAKFDVEKFLENNRLELDQKQEYSNPFMTGEAAKNEKEKTEKKHNQYENPFILNTNTNANNNTNLNLSELPPNFKNFQNTKEKNYQISKESNFYIDHEHNRENASGNNRENVYKLNKLSDTEFFKSGGKNLLKSIENNDINPEFDHYQQFKIDDMSKTNNNDIRSSEINNKEKDFQNNFPNLNTESKGDMTNENNAFGGNYPKNIIPRGYRGAEENLIGN